LSHQGRLEDVARAAAYLLEGGVVVFPTETFYALGAHFLRESALARIYKIKGRDERAPLLCLVDGMGRLGELVQAIPAQAVTLMEKFWPGPLTLVLPARPGIPSALTGHGRGVGVRWSSHPLAQALVAAVGAPVVGTSANLSGRPPAPTLAEIPGLILEQVDGLVDGGRLPGGSPSTVLDCTVKPFRMIREGAISLETLGSIVGTALAGG
jgi:L-threonylcarbamoyladenylate synthase